LPVSFVLYYTFISGEYRIFAPKLEEFDHTPKASAPIRSPYRMALDNVPRMPLDNRMPARLAVKINSLDSVAYMDGNESLRGVRLQPNTGSWVGERGTLAVGCLAQVSQKQKGQTAGWQFALLESPGVDSV
jgi:hypothetical protein